jgi:hypothetical protein
MSNHHIKMFVVDGGIVYILHNVDDPSNDQPGIHVSKPTGDKIRFQSQDGGFSIAFKTESPFENLEGGPGNPPIVSSDGTPTKLLTLKTIPIVKKKFPYTVILTGLQDDPEIIIDNSGGTGGGKKKKKK